MAGFRRNVQGGTDDVRRFKDETKAAQIEVAKLGTSSRQASNEVAAFARDSAGRMRNAKGQFAAAGGEAGRAFGDGLTRDAQGRLRSADGRFVAEGRRLGRSVNRGIASSLGSFAGVVQGSRGMLLLAGGATAAVAALQGVPPVLAAIGGGLGAIPGLAAGAAAALSTLAIGASGVGGAIGEIFDPPSGGGGGGGGAGIDRTAAALRRLEQAERGLGYAQRDARDAQVALNRARQQATRDLRDMSIQLAGLRLDERAATLGVAEAERELQALRAKVAAGDTSIDPLEIQRAELAYDQAQQTLLETQTRLQDLTVDQKKAAAAGVEGSELVQQALRDQERAYDAITDAQYAVLDAQEALAAASAGGGGGGAAAAATEYDKLSKNAKKFVDAIREQKDEILGLKNLAQDRIFAGLDREFTKTFTQTLPFARKQIIRFGDDWNQTFKNLARVGRDPQFLAGLDAALASSDRFFDGVNRRIPATGRMLSQMFAGSTVFIDRFGDTLLGYLDDFNAFIDRSARNGNLDRFFADAADQAEALLDIGKELFVLVGRLGGMRQGSTLLRDMADALERFNNEAINMRSVEGIIATGNAAIEGMIDVLLVLGEALGESLADPGTRDAVVIFFDVLRVGAEVIGSLAQIFSSLPDPIQSVILAGAALALVGSRLFGIFGKLEVGLSRANNRLGQMGPMGAQAAVGMERVGRAAKAAGIALLALQAGSLIVGQFAEAEVRADMLADSLEKLGKTGEKTGELQRLMGRDFADASKLFGAAADGWYQDTARFAESIPIFGDFQKSFSEAFHGQSFTSARANIATLDAQLADFARSTDDASVAQAAYTRLLQESGLDAAEFARLMPRAKAAVDEAQNSTRGANLQQRLYNASMAEAIDLAGGLSQALELLSGGTGDLRRAERDVQAAIDDANKSLEENGRTLDDNTAAGRANNEALDRIASSYRTLATVTYESTRATKGETAAQQAVIPVLLSARNQLINTAIQMGKNRGAAEAYADSILGIPRSWSTSLGQKGIPQAMKDMRAYKAFIKSIPTELYTYFTTVAKTEGFGRRQGRWGGISEDGGWDGGYVKAAEGKLREADIYGGVHPGRYMIAEAPTGGEAFIPKYGDKNRSVSIGRRAMEWYGYTVVPKQTLSGQHGQAMTVSSTAWQGNQWARPLPSVLELRSGGGRLDDLLLEILRRAVWQKGGDVQVVIGRS